MNKNPKKKYIEISREVRGRGKESLKEINKTIRDLREQIAKLEAYKKRVENDS